MTEGKDNKSSFKGVALEEYWKGARVDDSIAQMAQNPPKPQGKEVKKP